MSAVLFDEPLTVIDPVPPAAIVPIVQRSRVLPPTGTADVGAGVAETNAKEAVGIRSST